VPLFGNDELEVKKSFEFIRDFNQQAPDWCLLIEALRYPLLSVLSRFQRGGIGTQTPKPNSLKENTDQHLFSSKILMPIAQSAVSFFQMRRLKALQSKGLRIVYVSPNDRFFDIYSTFFQLKDLFFITDRVTWNRRLFSAIVAERSSDFSSAGEVFIVLNDALRALGISLTYRDNVFLQAFCRRAVGCLYRARKFFDCYPVSGLVVDGDSWLPINLFCSIAKEHDISVICLQHGLDCEHWCLNDAFSQYYCVWGVERKRRYILNSTYQPDKIFVTGNPLFDQFSPPKAVSNAGNRWLLLTRPHSLEKCYEPSRYPEEGAVVLSRILELLSDYPNVQLFIRPHPKDNTSYYDEVLNSSTVSRRVFLSDVSQSLYKSIEEADIVFTEDSTSGMEAMIFEKPVVHVSACKAGPVLPFVDYGAAYSGLCLDALKDSVSLLMHGFDSEEKAKMHRGQLNFLHDFCGELDGKAAQRVANSIMEIM